MNKIITIIIFLCLISGISYAQNTWNQYSIATNTVTQIPFTLISTASSNNTNGDAGFLPVNFSSDTSRQFFPLDIVNDPNAYPWRITVKFGNTTGLLIDPYHVLTAGHAVSLNQGFGNTKIMPAYSQGDSPFGYAYPEYVYILTNYSVTTQSDIAIIKLDRPIGALTGWSGYGYNNNQDFFLSQNNFYNTSYPSAGLYDGELLYNWKGKLEYITTEYAYSFRTGIVGMSGSGLFTFQNNIPITYGILLSSGIKFNKINANKYDGITKIITNNTPAGFDLIPMVTSVYPKVIKQGNSPDSISFYVHNYSTQNYTNQQATAKIYLSTDSIITNADQLLNTINITDYISAKKSIKIKSTDINLSGLGSGNYWVGIILSGDNNSANNTTDYRDAFKINIASTNYVRISGSISSSQTRDNISGVTLQGLSENIKTDYNGSYTAFVPAGWSGTITPAREGYEFAPSSFAVNNASGNITKDFSAAKKIYQVSVNVKSPIQHIGVSGVTLSGMVGEPYSDESGKVVVNLYHGWSGTVYLSKDGWNIQPYSVDYNKVSSSTNTPINAGFTISGYLYDGNGGAMSNIQMQGLPGNVVSNNYGYYTSYLDSGWTGTVHPYKLNSGFNPGSRVYTSLYSNNDYQDYQEISTIYLNLKVFLSGAYSDGSDTMKTDLNSRGFLPSTPPDSFSNYQTPFIFKPHKPYIYSGQPANVVDWISIEVLDYNFVPIDTTAALLRNDGQVITATGETLIPLDFGILPDYYYVIIRQRNHIAILSNYQIYACTNPDLYDFTYSTDMVFGNDMKRLKDNLYGMYAGDADYDGNIDEDDFKAYNTSSINAVYGYILSDFNLDGYVTSYDFMLIAPNKKLGITTKIFSPAKKSIRNHIRK
ncbi:MAG: trypsin-like serine protease [Ignavibacteria bacterium]|nr:trypsin-like serine protease [Ignavibacteria bacterium]